RSEGSRSGTQLFNGFAEPGELGGGLCLSLLDLVEALVNLSGLRYVELFQRPKFIVDARHRFFDSLAIEVCRVGSTATGWCKMVPKARGCQYTADGAGYHRQSNHRRDCRNPAFAGNGRGRAVLIRRRFHRLVDPRAVISIP